MFHTNILRKSPPNLKAWYMIGNDQKQNCSVSVWKLTVYKADINTNLPVKYFPLKCCHHRENCIWIPPKTQQLISIATIEIKHNRNVHKVTYKNRNRYSLFSQKREHRFWWNFHRVVLWYAFWKLDDWNECSLPKNQHDQWCTMPLMVPGPLQLSNPGM